MPPGGVHEGVRRSGAPAGHRVEARELPGPAIDGEGGDGARRAVVHDIGGVGRVQMRACGVDGDRAGARVMLAHPDRRERAGASIDAKDVDASPVGPRRGARGRRIPGRGAIGSDVRESLATIGSRLLGLQALDARCHGGGHRSQPRGALHERSTSQGAGGESPAGRRAHGGRHHVSARPPGQGAASRSGSRGSDRRRLPVAEKTAAARAGAVSVIGDSPAPAASTSRRSISCTSIAGTSRKRGSR